MQYRPALTCWKRLTSRRGAVFLLSVYFTSLVLLILGGISLQRTMTENRAAQVSRDTQQAFYLAEGALDVALTRLHTSDLLDGAYGAEDQTALPVLNGLPTGARVMLTTTAAQVLNPTTQQISRQVRATGVVPSGVTAQVTASITQQGPLKGAWMNGPLWIRGNTLDSGIFRADLRSGLGTKKGLRLTSRVHHQGQLQIAASAATTETYELTSFEHVPWQTPIGDDSATDPGVYLQTSFETPTSNSESGEAPLAPAVAPVLPIEPIVSPYPAAQCSGTLTMTTPNETLMIVDGNANPPDLSPAGDGKIVLCLQYVNMAAAGARVVFRSPSTVYVTGKDVATGFAVSAKDFYAVGPGLIPDTAPLLRKGVQLVVTKAPEGSIAGTVSLQTKRFDGSIYAPQSIVYFTHQDHGEYRFRSIVGRESQMFTFGFPMTIGIQTNDTNIQPTTITLKSWSSD